MGVRWPVVRGVASATFSLARNRFLRIFLSRGDEGRLVARKPTTVRSRGSIPPREFMAWETAAAIRFWTANLPSEWEPDLQSFVRNLSPSC